MTDRGSGDGCIQPRVHIENDLQKLLIGKQRKNLMQRFQVPDMISDTSGRLRHQKEVTEICGDTSGRHAAVLHQL